MKNKGRLKNQSRIREDQKNTTIMCNADFRSDPSTEK